jgi:hypothetical protein
MAFRFSRRTPRSRGLMLFRLLKQAIRARPDHRAAGGLQD